MGVGVGPDLEAGLAHGEPVGLPRDRLVAAQQGEDGLQRLLHHPALVDGIDAHDEGVARQRPWAGAEDHPAAREVVEQDQAAGQRVVVGEDDPVPS